MYFVQTFLYFVFQARLAQKRADEVQVRSSGRNRRQEGPKVRSKCLSRKFRKFQKFSRMNQFLPRVSLTPTTGQVLPEKTCSSNSNSLSNPFSAVYTCSRFIQYLEMTPFRPFFVKQIFVLYICQDKFIIQRILILPKTM